MIKKKDDFGNVDKGRRVRVVNGRPAKVIGMISNGM
jgi:hypothetical protein